MFVCLKCNKSFNKKHHLEYHTSRKRPCIKEELIKNDSVIIENKDIVISQSTNVSINNIVINRLYTCNICEKKYNHKQSLYRHKLQLVSKKVYKNHKKFTIFYDFYFSIL